MDATAALVIVLVPIGFVAIWVGVTTIIRLVAGMKRQLDVEPGAMIRSSSWGSALVNGVRMKRTLRIEEYREGYLLRMPWVFGGGQLWLPKRGLEVGDLVPAKLFWPARRPVVSGKNRITLYRDLASFVEPPARG